MNVSLLYGACYNRQLFYCVIQRLGMIPQILDLLASQGHLMFEQDENTAAELRAVVIEPGECDLLTWCV